MFTLEHSEPQQTEVCNIGQVDLQLDKNFQLIAKQSVVMTSIYGLWLFV